jgi:muramidase (phage lysozyme)
MNRTAIAALVLAAVLFWPRRASAAGTDPATSDTSPPQPQAIDNPDAVIIQDAEVQPMSLPIDVQAFLYMIRSCEHRFPTDVVNDDCYEIFYGGTRFIDLSDHPVITGELAPVPLPEHMCKAAGLNSPCYSTAAGAYQMIRPTWTRLRDQLGLEDFSKDSQDRAAVELLRQNGIIAMIEAGEIEAAIKKAGKVWAGLPGNTYQQSPRQLQYALDRFAEGQTIYSNLA